MHKLYSHTSICLEIFIDGSLRTGIWKQKYGSDGKVTDIFFYRQMSSDELYSKVRNCSLSFRLHACIMSERRGSRSAHCASSKSCTMIPSPMSCTMFAVPNSCTTLSTVLLGAHAVAAHLHDVRLSKCRNTVQQSLALHDSIPSFVCAAWAMHSCFDVYHAAV